MDHYGPEAKSCKGAGRLDAELAAFFVVGDVEQAILELAGRLDQTGAGLVAGFRRFDLDDFADQRDIGEQHAAVSSGFGMIRGEEPNERRRDRLGARDHAAVRRRLDPAMPCSLRPQSCHGPVKELLRTSVNGTRSH